MPLEQRVISPIYVARGCFNTGAVGQNPNIPNELECVTNGTLSNIIRQLSSMSKYAEDLFGGLLDDIGVLVQRSTNLQQRINVLTDHVEQLDASSDPVGRANFQRIRPVMTRTEHLDQQVVARSTIPVSLQDVYERCDPPPPLDKLNPFRDDNIDGLRFYTNPNYFFELWRKEMLTDRTRNKVAKNRQGENAHPSGKSKRKQNRLHHQHSNKSDNSSTHQSPQMPGLNQVGQPVEYYGDNGMMMNQKGGHHVHYQTGNAAQQSMIYNYQQTGQPAELVAMKREEPNPSGIGTYTVIEGSYIDPNNYQHHYVQHNHYNGNETHPPPPPPPPLNSAEYQKQQSNRPNSLELSHSNPQEYNITQQQQQSHYGTQNTTYYSHYNNNAYGPGNQRSSYGSTSYMASGQQQTAAAPPPPPPPGQQGQQQYPSPGSAMTPTRRASQLSRPSAPPPAPPSTGSTPNSNPSTPLHKKMSNGPEMDNNARISRDSLPPPPPLPTTANAHNLSNGNDVDGIDSSLPPPPPPLPANNYNDNVVNSPPPPPPPPMNNGPMIAPSSTNQITANTAQFKSNSKPTAEMLQSVKLKKMVPQQPEEHVDARSNLLAAIRHGIKLKRVEETRAREVEKSTPLHDVASILARRVAMQLSDSEAEGDDDDDSDAWNDDETEC